MRLFARYVTYKRYASTEHAVICTLRNVPTSAPSPCSLSSPTNTTMDDLQSLVSADAFLTTHYSDIELIEDTSPCTNQSSVSTISLPPAPSSWLKPPPLRFLAVSDTNSDALAKTQRHIERVALQSIIKLMP